MSRRKRDPRVERSLFTWWSYLVVLFAFAAAVTITFALLFDVIAEDLNKMAAELGSVEALRTDFAANVSHEMKTPLSVMSNYATIMQDPTLTEGERIEYARRTGEAARRLSGMVANTLRLNKLENQAIFPEFGEFDLTEQMAECILGMSDAFDQKGVELEVELADGSRRQRRHGPERDGVQGHIAHPVLLAVAGQAELHSPF